VTIFIIKSKKDTMLCFGQVYCDPSHIIASPQINPGVILLYFYYYFSKCCWKS